jgi:hypothetical protein
MSISSLSTVLQSSQARRSARIILMILAHHTNAGGYAWPSVPTIAHEAQLSIRTVQYNLRKLERMGELKTLVAAGPKGWALVHQYAQPIECITSFDLTQKNVPC